MTEPAKLEKAYDFKVLAQRLSIPGREITEEMAKEFIEKGFDWLEESAVLSETKVDDLLSVMYPTAKAQALKYADKIDGQLDS